ncbi:hypothetical protein VCRA2119O147_1020004 [Vibrio crassostreae]|nr:hypothetical protein VCRA2112O187_30033 [Vibrio crassostreae]CAK2182478.1 hypothetical protein VCRA2112O191_50045 [Vibrio crassostreae]CAK2187877.1 hypothetical protein VCRA2116O234_50171 [Vibrio crassostreae]CAK2203885.1 hypothetical protein VCRA2110O173_60045 [Vibrio crassostreae]CAK2209962.1 hypothetical protein VCRA2113O206_60044 [Vibrio crassostreae]
MTNIPDKLIGIVNDKTLLIILHISIIKKYSIFFIISLYAKIEEPIRVINSKKNNTESEPSNPISLIIYRPNGITNRFVYIAILGNNFAFSTPNSIPIIILFREDTKTIHDKK